MKRLLASLGAGLFLAAGTSVLATTPAQAAACSQGTGVTVIVDFGSLGKPTAAGCDPATGGERAGQSFVDAGFPLTYATKDAGFVCRVSGLPADDPCTDAAPSDRYWSLWWADGKGGPWIYASRGVGSLRAPEGGYVAFRFHTGSARASAPAVAPTSRVRATASPAPTSAPPKPQPGPTRKPRPGSKGSAPASAAASAPANARATATPSVAPSASLTASASASPSATASASPSTSASATASATSSVTASATGSATPSAGVPAANEITAGPQDVTPTAAQEKNGLPVWVPIVVVVALVGVAGGLAARRRTR